MNIIVRDFVRPDPALVKGFEGIPTGVVSDAMGRGNSMAAEIKPVWPGAKVLGPAFTVRTFPADNLMIHNLPISCGGIPMRPGDIILGDADGVAVIPQEHASEILAKAQAGVGKEQQLRERIGKGEFLFDILKLDGVLKSLGVVEP